MRLGLVLWFAIGCGRLGFSDRAISDAAVTDAAARRGACGAPGTAPDPFAFAGTVVRFSSFNTTVPVPGVLVTAYDATTGDMLGTATSDGSGAYGIEIGGGVARALRLDTSGPDASYWQTHQFTGRWIAGNVAGYQTPIWNGGAIDVVYGAAGSGFMPDGSDGNINIELETCDGTPIGGGTIALSLPSQKLEYLGSDDAPDPSATQTGSSNGAAVGFNVTLGSGVITASAPGQTFDPFSIAIGGGTQTNVVVLFAREADD